MPKIQKRETISDVLDQSECLLEVVEGSDLSSQGWRCCRKASVNSSWRAFLRRIDHGAHCGWDVACETT